MSEQQKVGEVIEIAAERFNSIIEDTRSALVYDAEKGFAIQHLKNNSFLMKAAQESPESLQAAMANVAGVGLSLNPAEKLAYLIPRNVKVSNNQYKTKIFYEPSYMGLIRLATDSGSVLWCQAETVRKGEQLIMGAVGEPPEHKRDVFGRDPEVIGAYCVAKTADGSYLTTTMTIDEIIDIRERTEIFKKARKDKKQPYGPWVTDFNEQAKKTVIRRAFKTWPRTDQSKRMALAVDLSNENEGFDPIVNTPPSGQYTAREKEFYDNLISSNNALGMYVFQQTTDATINSSLYNSFERGTIVRFKGIVDELYNKGASAFEDYINVYQEAKHNGDDAAIKQIRLEISDEEFNYLEERA